MIRHLAIFLTALQPALLAGIHAADVPEPNSTSKPNFIIIFTDDQGYGERNDILAHHPDVAERLRSYAINFQEELSRNKRPAGEVKNPKPLTKIELPK